MATSVRKFLATVIASVIFNSQLFMISSMPTGDPILIVPGITGSQLQVKRSGASPCSTFGRNVSLWINEARFLKFRCFLSELMLSYDRNTGQYSSTSDSITVSVPGFGDTYLVERKGNGLLIFPVFDVFVDYFVKRGYERGKSIRAAPYDWRLGPEELQRRGYYDNVKGLIETMYRENGNHRVTIAAHSMGAPIMLHFLTQSGVVTQEWKDQFIGNFIPIAGAWSGGNEAVECEISGLRVNKWMPGYLFSLFSYIQDSISDLTIPFLRSFQSIYFLLPRPSVWGDTVLVTTPARSYTASDYQQLFSDIGLTDGFAMYQGVENINRGFPSPNVPTHCFYGVGIDTLESFHYARPFPEGADMDPEVTMGDGDGSVNLRSSQICLRWANNNGGRPFRSMVFEGVDHGAMIRTEDVLWEIGRIVGASN